MRNQGRSGFTLIELMVTVAIVGVLAAIAYPSYTQYVLKGNRSSAQSVMMNAASKQEQYFLDNRAYTSTISDLVTIPSDVTARYTITTSAIAATGTTPPGFEVKAVPINAQAADTKCGTLRVLQDGSKTISGTSTPADCWK